MDVLCGVGLELVGGEAFCFCDFEGEWDEFLAVDEDEQEISHVI